MKIFKAHNSRCVRVNKKVFAISCSLPTIANVQGLSSTLDGDGGIAAPKKILSTFLQFQEGWGDFSPFFLPVQQENCLLIESKDFLYSSRRAKL